MRKPLISVILPAYNAQKYIKQSILSILHQSVKDFELIIINDGSIDSTINIIKEYATLDSRIRLIDRENRGLVYSLNEGISISSGSWIARMDADDISLKNRFLNQIKYAKYNNLDVCGCYVKCFGYCLPAIRRYPITPEAVRLQLMFNSCFAHPTVMAKSHIFKENNYNQKYEQIEDYELWTRLAQKNYQLGNIPEVLLRYRRSFSQNTSVNRLSVEKYRLSVATEYAHNNVNLFEYSVIQTLNNRYNKKSENEILIAISSLKNLISRGYDREGVLAKNLDNFLIHNSIYISAKKIHRIKKQLKLSFFLILLVLRVLRLSPMNRFWNLLYLLK